MLDQRWRRWADVDKCYINVLCLLGKYSLFIYCFCFDCYNNLDNITDIFVSYKLNPLPNWIFFLYFLPLWAVNCYCNFHLGVNENYTIWSKISMQWNKRLLRPSSFQGIVSLFIELLFTFENMPYPSRHKTLGRPCTNVIQMFRVCWYDVYIRH